jgi:hypothetical protein
MSSSEGNEYEIFNFTFPKNDENKDEDKKFDIKNYKYEHKYLISKENYEDGIKYLKKRNRNFNNKNFFYYYKYENVLEGKNYVLVDDNFLKALKCNEEFVKNKYVVYFESKGKHFIYFKDDQILEITDLNKENEEENKNEIKEEEKNKGENNKEDKENNITNKKQETDENEEQIIIKSLILLYANEIHFEKLLNSPIVDEYDLKNYYLINPTFIEEFKENNNYQQFLEILDAEKYNYSYKGFCFNIDKILEIPQIKKLKLKPKQYKEKYFYPKTNKIEPAKKDKTINFPDKFILVHKNLFDLLYKSIKEDKYSPEDYN